MLHLRHRNSIRIRETDKTEETYRASRIEAAYYPYPVTYQPKRNRNTEHCHLLTSGTTRNTKTVTSTSTLSPTLPRRCLRFDSASSRFERSPRCTLCFRFRLRINFDSSSSSATPQHTSPPHSSLACPRTVTCCCTAESLHEGQPQRAHCSHTLHLLCSSTAHTEPNLLDTTHFHFHLVEQRSGETTKQFAASTQLSKLDKLTKRLQHWLNTGVSKLNSAKADRARS